MKRFILVLCCLMLCSCWLLPAGAEGFADQEALTGICITRLPEVGLGSVMLGSRQLRPGDVVTAEQLSEITFVPGASGEEGSASISYLPVFAQGLSGETTATFSFRGRENKPPIAEDHAFETYKNLDITEQLKVREPEGQPMTFTLTREPKRGTVTIGEDGSFTYTPKKNKVGIDSFTFTAADPEGKVSREATVTITILKPRDARQYTDTQGKSCRFAAEWMKNTGIFVGESLDGNPCFSPEKQVTRGEMLTMLVKALELPTDPEVTQTGFEDAPNWLKPYLAAAVRSGLLSTLPTAETFGCYEPIRAQEAAAMLCAALELDDGTGDPLEVAAENGFRLESDGFLTRGDTAELIYQAAKLSEIEDFSRI